MIAALACFVALPASGSEREPLEVGLFARVPAPGSPEGIAVDSRGRVFVATSPKQGGPLADGPPSKVFVYDRRGLLRREYTIEGQDLTDPFYGLVGIAFDGADRLYAADIAPPRIIRLNPRTGRQRDYVRFPDVPPCSATVSPQCSETIRDLAPLPDYPVFAPDGTLYVTDLDQALIWRVPRGGGKAEVRFSEQGLESLFGPNGAQFLADGRTLLFVLSTQSSPFASPQRSPGLYRLRLPRDGTPASARQLWESSPSDVPDGFALGRSGKAYVALAGTTGNAVAVISPSGTELARTPATEVENQMMEVPFDQPASAAFHGRRLLVTNHALFSRNPEHFAVLEVYAGERGLPLFRPRMNDRRTRGRASGAG